MKNKITTHWRCSRSAHRHSSPAHRTTTLRRMAAARTGRAGHAGRDGPGGRMGRRPPPSPLMEALDVNHDGVIDSNEIANAPAELKTLDKNGDGQLTQDELRPPMDGGPLWQ